jgi:hypothetical protein
VYSGGGGNSRATAQRQWRRWWQLAPIETADTSYGRDEAEQKRNVVWARRKKMPEEREDLHQVINKMDTSDAVTAAANKNEPTNITPV